MAETTDLAPRSLKEMLNNPETVEKFEKMLGKRTQSFFVSLTAAVNGNLQLQRCQPKSVLMAASIAASLNLPVDPNLGLSYIIPYGDKAQFQIGVKGFTALAVRSGIFRHIGAMPITVNDKVKGNALYGFQFELSEDRAGEVIGYAAYFQLSNGFESEVYMTRAQAEAHGKKYSKLYAANNRESLWIKDFDAAATKTVLKKLLNSGKAPLSIEMETAIKFDQAAVNKDGNPDYVDNAEEGTGATEVKEDKGLVRTREFLKDAKWEDLEEPDLLLAVDEYGLKKEFDERRSLLDNRRSELRVVLEKATDLKNVKALEEEAIICGMYDMWVARTDELK